MCVRVGRQQVSREREGYVDSVPTYNTRAPAGPQSEAAVRQLDNEERPGNPNAVPEGKNVGVCDPVAVVSRSCLRQKVGACRSASVSGCGHNTSRLLSSGAASALFLFEHLPPLHQAPVSIAFGRLPRTPAAAVLARDTTSSEPNAYLHTIPTLGPSAGSPSLLFKA